MKYGNASLGILPVLATNPLRKFGPGYTSCYPKLATPNNIARVNTPLTNLGLGLPPCLHCRRLLQHGRLPCGSGVPGLHCLVCRISIANLAIDGNTLVRPRPLQPMHDVCSMGEVPTVCARGTLPHFEDGSTCMHAFVCMPLSSQHACIWPADRAAPPCLALIDVHVHAGHPSGCGRNLHQHHHHNTHERGVAGGWGRLQHGEEDAADGADRPSGICFVRWGSV